MNYSEIWSYISQKKRTLIFVTIISSILGALLELLFLGSLYPFIVIILSPAGSTENELFNSVISFLPILSAENLIFTVTSYLYL